MDGYEEFPSADGVPPGWGEYLPPVATDSRKLLSGASPPDEPGASEASVPLAPWAGQNAPVPNWQQQPAATMAMVPQGQRYRPYDAVGDPPSPPEASTSHMLGLATVAVAVGAAVGLHYGGPFGGLAGSMIGGAAVNAYRAVAFYRQGTPEADHEAKVSGAYAVLAAAGGGYLSYRMSSSSPPRRRNPVAEDEDEPTSCRPRPVG